MTMSCTICTHDKRLQIDQAIIQGKSFQSIAKSFGVDAQCISRHAKNHLSRQLLKHDEIRERISSGRILDEVEDLLTRTKRILRDSEADNQRGMALGAIREIRSTLEFLSKLALTLASIQQQEATVENEVEEQAKRENIGRLELCELNLLGDIQSKISGEIPWKRLLPDSFYQDEADYINIHVNIPKGNADVEPERIVVHAPDQGGSTSIKTSTLTENFVDIGNDNDPVPAEKDPVQGVPSQDKQDEPEPTTMTRRKPFAKIYFGPGMPEAAKRRAAKEYIRNHGSLPPQQWLRDAL